MTAPKKTRHNASKTPRPPGLPNSRSAAVLGSKRRPKDIHVVAAAAPEPAIDEEDGNFPPPAQPVERPAFGRQSLRLRRLAEDDAPAVRRPASECSSDVGRRSRRAGHGARARADGDHAPLRRAPRGRAPRAGPQLRLIRALRQRPDAGPAARGVATVFNGRVATSETDTQVDRRAQGRGRVGRGPRRRRRRVLVDRRPRLGRARARAVSSSAARRARR